MIRLRPVAIALVAVLLAAPPAAAHKPSDSYLALEVNGAAVSGQWDIALRDLDHAIGLDADDDGALTWGEVRGRHDAIAAYALSRLRIDRAGRRCDLAPVQHLVDTHSDGAYTVLRFDARCAAAEGPLSIGYALFFDLDPQHRGLLRLAGAERTVTAVFGPDSPPLQIDAGSATSWQQLRQFVAEGVWHIWAGFDHLLFLLALLLPAVLRYQDGRWQPVARPREAVAEVVKVVTAFTLAHSATLCLATLGWIDPPARLVEPVIAASIVLAALNNVYPVVTRGLWAVAFGFGLIHGMGFAGALRDLGLPTDTLLLALFGFNVGVELGQLAVVAAFLPLALMLRGTRSYRLAALQFGSVAVAATATLWLFERAFGIAMI